MTYQNAERSLWVDFAKGLSIILVVNMHTTLGIEAATGQPNWMNAVVEFAATFRMPLFFMVAGLFLVKTVSTPWKTFIDKKVLHFAYFYLLWLALQTGLKDGLEIGFEPAVMVTHYLERLIQPFGTLWFIYILPIFFVVTRLTWGLPKLLVLAFALVLHLLPIHTGSLIVDEFATYFVFFLLGAHAPDLFFRIARLAENMPLRTLAIVTVFAIINGVFVSLSLSPMVAAPLESFLKLISVPVLVGFSAVLASSKLAKPILYCGEKSIVIYLSFFLFMAVGRIVGLKLGIESGTLALLVTIAAVIGPLVMDFILRKIGITFLFERPKWARI